MENGKRSGSGEWRYQGRVRLKLLCRGVQCGTVCGRWRRIRWAFGLGSSFVLLFAEAKVDPWMHPGPSSRGMAGIQSESKNLRRDKGWIPPWLIDEYLNISPRSQAHRVFVRMRYASVFQSGVRKGIRRRTGRRTVGLIVPGLRSSRGEWVAARFEDRSEGVSARESLILGTVIARIAVPPAKPWSSRRIHDQQILGFSTSDGMREARSRSELLARPCGKTIRCNARAAWSMLRRGGPGGS